MQRIEMPCYDMVIEGGEISSSLKDGSPLQNAVMGGIEQVVLAHAQAGVDVESDAYVEGVETAVEAVSANLEGQ